MNKLFLYFLLGILFSSIVLASLDDWNPNAARNIICSGYGDKYNVAESDISSAYLKLVVYDPNGDEKPDNDPLPISQTCKTHAVACAEKNYIDNTVLLYDVLKSICSIGEMADGKGREGMYDFYLETDNDAECKFEGARGLDVQWDEETSWCELDQCGYGQYNASNTLNDCCSAREMNSIFEYTNEDCGSLEMDGNNLCYFMNNMSWNPAPTPDEGRWLRAGDLEGEIVYMGCEDIKSTNVADGYEYVSVFREDLNEYIWHKCTENGYRRTTPEPNFLTVSALDVNDEMQEHEYICIDIDAPSIYSIAECNPTRDPFLNYQMRDSGINARGGQSVEISDNRVYYCTNLSTWEQDLDSYDLAGPQGKYCNNARLPPERYDSATLAGQRFTIAGISKSPKWTGSLCCGETDDWGTSYPDGKSYGVDNEYYNDDDRDNPDYVSYNSAGACYNSWYQPNESFLKIYNNEGEEKEVKEVMIWHDTFQGCAIDEDKALQNKENTQANEGKVSEKIKCALPKQNDIHKPYEGSFKHVNVPDLYQYPNSQRFSNDFLLSLKDKPNPGKNSGDEGNLIHDNEYCNIKKWGIKQQKFYCSYNGTWVSQGFLEENRSHLSFIPWKNSSLQQAECCKPNQCWNGETCVDSISDTLTLTEPEKIMNEYGDGFVCVDGDWEWAYKKSTWLGDNVGYCMKNTQCLIDPEAELSLTDTISPTKYDIEGLSGLELPHCIDDGEYYLDHYCENGAWTSRTKYVALDLYNMYQGSSGYTLYCDSHDKVLNNVDYYVPGSFSNVDEEYFEANQELGCYSYKGDVVPCINHMCVLVKEGSAQDDVFLGMSLNVNPDSLVTANAGVVTDLGEAFGATLSTCNPDSTTLEPCGNDNLYYNAEKNILIFSKKGIPSNYDFVTTLGNLFKGFVKALVDLVSTTSAQDGYDYSLFNDLADDLYEEYSSKPSDRPEFSCEDCSDNNDNGDKKEEVCGLEGNPDIIYDLNTFYLSEKSGKKIFGMAEVQADDSLVPYRMIGLVFEGFTEDICETFNDKMVAGYKCIKKGDNYLVMTKPVALSNEISYDSIVDVSEWEQWVFLGPSTRIG